MSGHSKWSTIKRKKGVADAKRGKVFTKLIREIQTAARMGGSDLEGNPRLRLAIEKARGSNMPKDNIERAVQKGAGGGDGGDFEEIVYEGYGPGGVAILLATLTDNRNRTGSDVRHLLTKHGGNLGAAGCVSYLFEKRGTILFSKGSLNVDELLEASLEAGAEDVREFDEFLEVITSPGSLTPVRESLERAEYVANEASISMEPRTTVTLIGNQAEKMLRLHDALEDLDDVQVVFANFDISEDEMAKIE